MISPRTSIEFRFKPELLLGYDAIRPADRRILGEFLLSVIRLRGFPLHVTSLWNALYFGYDLEEPAYFGRGINLDRIPQRRMGQQGGALPVGGFVRVQVGSEELWAEVVYKEGRRNQISWDSVPPELSGAPIHDGTGKSTVPETLVLDYSAFGPHWNDIPPKKYARLLRQGRWLDQFGHLVMDAQYPPENPPLDDATFYARYLFEQHREGLGLLASYLGSGATDDDLWAHLLISIRTVSDIAQHCAELASWRDYFFDRAQFAAAVHDEGVDARLGADDLRQLFKCIATVPRREHVIYSAIGPQILEILARQGLDDDERALIDGPKYVQSVCFANACIRDRLAEEAPEGIVNNCLHLRLDDARLAGGIWRSERTNDPTASILRIPPTIPLGLGYSSTLDAERHEAPDESPVITSSQVGWHVALTRSDIDAGKMRLSVSAAEAVAKVDAITIRLRHGHEPTDQSEARYHPESRRILNVEWPWDAYPGIYVFGNIERGGTIIKLRTEMLALPETIDGHVLSYRFDSAIYRREREPVSRQKLNNVTSLEDLIQLVFQDRGTRTASGGRALSMVEVLNAILGPDSTPDTSRSVRLALEALDLEFTNGLYIWYPRVTRRTRVRDRTLLVTYGEESQDHIRRIVRRHWVPMHLRRILTGEQPGRGKQESYAREVKAAGLSGYFPGELPAGYTWVIGHSRGSRTNGKE